MVSKNTLKFCCEDISLIENYNKAINDRSQSYICHHRLETDKNMSVKELIEKNLYYNRPANELILLTFSEHSTLHNKGRLHSKETKEKQSKIKQKYFETHTIWNKGLKTGPQSEETKLKKSISHIGKHPSEETKQKQSERMKKWWKDKKK